MCIFSQPSAPQVVYQGPSRADIEANQRALDDYRKSMSDQQTQFTAALQKQIDDANTQAEKQRLELEQQRTAATAEMAAQQQGAYAATVQTVQADNAVTTTPPKPKDKSKSTLKIAPGATAMTEGTGLNIGV